MRVETMKSVILVLLIGLSLFFSVALWNYQPKGVYEGESQTISDTKLEEVGRTNTLRQLIEPMQYVFHENSLHYSYASNEEKSNAYKMMKDWQLTPHEEQEPLPDLEEHPHVEIIFPTDLPIEVVNHIFTIQNKEISGVESFDRIYVVMTSKESDTNTYDMWAIESDDESDLVKFYASIDETSGDRLFGELETKNDLVEQLRIVNEEDSETRFYDGIYIPKGEQTYPQQILQTNSVKVRVLQNYLFPQATNITRHTLDSGVVVISDFERELTVYDEYLKYEYKIPNEANPADIRSYELLMRSISDINAHLGWTNDFRLDSLFATKDKVEYRLYFNELPVLAAMTGVAQIILDYEQGEIQEYIRPKNQFIPTTFVTEDNKAVTLPSGQEVVDYIEANYNPAEIDKVKVGYELEEQSTTLAYSLIPKWFMYENGIWKPVFTAQGILKNKVSN